MSDPRSAWRWRGAFPLRDESETTLPADVPRVGF